jgi:hypothetical protein
MMDSIGSIIYHTYEIINIFSPSIPYFFQIKKFNETQSSVGFSKKVSLLIIISSIWRIFFWFGRRYHYTLLMQSILLVFMQLYVISSAIKYKVKSKENKVDDKSISDFEWDSLSKYVSFLTAFISIFMLLSNLLTFENQLYVDTLGSLSSITEVALLLPQIFENQKHKSTKNLSNVVVTCWFVGDIIKTYYFLVSEAPSQLFIGGVLQVTLDAIIVAQVFWYRKNKIL